MRPTWMVAAKANASEDVVPEFVGDLIPFDKARATMRASLWTAGGNVSYYLVRLGSICLLSV